MNAPEHDRCSQLLRGYVDDELTPDDRAWVEEHVRACPGCAQELAALRALLPEADTPRLSELEKVSLRRVVLNQAVPLPDAGDAPAAAPRSGSRIFQLLGAAALLAMIGAFAYLGLGGIGGGDEQAASTGSGDRDQSLEVESGAESLKDGRAGGTVGATSGSTSDAASAPPPPPTFRAALGEVDRERLNRLGKHGLPLVVFSRAYTVDDVPALHADFIERLAARAPDARGEDIRRCAALVTSQFPNSLPAYAALAEYRNRGDILVLAFAWTNREEGPLDRSMVWAWAVDDCDGIPVHYSTSIIEPQK